MRNTYVVTIIYFLFPDPFLKVIQAGTAVHFLQNSFNKFRLILNFVLQPPKKHPKKVRIHIPSLLLLEILIFQALQVQSLLGLLEKLHLEGLTLFLTSFLGFVFTAAFWLDLDPMNSFVLINLSFYRQIKLMGQDRAHRNKEGVIRPKIHILLIKGIRFLQFY